jgi:hypothetical protein
VDFSNENYTALEGPTLPPPHVLVDNGPLSYSGVDTIIHNVPNNTGQKDALRHSYNHGLAFQQKGILPQILGSLIPSQTTQGDKRTWGVQSTLANSEHSKILPVLMILQSFVTIRDVSGIHSTVTSGLCVAICNISCSGRNKPRTLRTTDNYPGLFLLG